MKKMVLAGALATCAFAAPVQAGGAYCTPDWRPESPNLNCASQIAIAPGNDTRVNLYLLMQDRAGSTGNGLAMPDTGWGGLYGKNYFKWETLRAAYLPQPASEEGNWSSHSGTRCQTIDTGKAAFLAAIDQSKKLKNRDRVKLAELRDRLAEACKDGPGTWGEPGEGGYFANVAPNSIKRDPANGFLAYLEGSAAFYSGDWTRASEYYAMIAERTREPWLKDTATYMRARTLLNQAITSGVNRWGNFKRNKTKKEKALAAEQAFLEYLSAYPEGRYAGSARGLLRKTSWMRGDEAALGTIYSQLIPKTDTSTEQAANLVEEVDYRYYGYDRDALPEDTLLLATQLLQRMRFWDRDQMPEDIVSAEELASLKSTFAEQPELYSFLRANHAFHIAQDYRAVLDLLPDAARADSYTPLAFSRQHLRGLALHALGDRNEEGFWLDLIKGSKGVWQRQSVELALARLYEQQGQLDKVFASRSPIKDRTIRRVLLGQSADMATLKRVAREEAFDTSERSFALYTALLKQLQHGQYRGLLEDFPLISQFSEGEKDGYGHWDLFDREVAPVKTFTEGIWSDGYACPQLQETVRTLARNPSDIDGRLCMGDFIRLNGFDGFEVSLDPWRNREEEGPAALGSKRYYEGKPLHRLDFYKSIIDDRRASAKQRAYALYRGVWCYGPTGNNSCGSDVPVETRAAWFRRLKRDYPDSQWAKDLKYYW